MTKARDIAGSSLESPNRNLLYNGAMQVAQRGTSATGITGGGYYAADRWVTQISSAGTWTNSVENDGPSGSGLTKSAKWLCTTAAASPGAASYMLIEQRLEGQDVQRLAFGTPSAKQVTLSFWVKSNVTGTYAAELRVAGSTPRTISRTYSISASATWEKKILTFPGDTIPVIANDNASALIVEFWLVAGSNFSTGSINTSWLGTSGNDATRAVGQTNLAAATNNYWQITGVQLEVGDTATDFEFKSFGQELRECQRYYQYWDKGFINFMQAYRWTSTRAFVMLRIPEMRTAPSLDASSGTNYFAWYFAGGLGGHSNSITLNNSTSREVDFYADITGGTAGHAGFLSGANAAAYIALTAEL